MKKRTLGFLLAMSMSLTSGIALTDVISDIADGLPPKEVIENALDSGLTLEEAVQQAIQAAPALAEQFIFAAVRRYPAQAQAVVNGAAAAGIDPGQAVRFAIAAGAPPATVNASAARTFAAQQAARSTSQPGVTTNTATANPATTGGTGGGAGGGGGGTTVSNGQSE